MGEHASLNELAARAVALAHRRRGGTVTAAHVVWAYVEAETGAEAIALRVACRCVSPPLVRALPEPPEWQPGVREALVAAAVEDVVGPREVLSFARALSAPSLLLLELETWVKVREAGAAAPVRPDEPVAAPQPAVIWERFELDDGSREGIAFVEITRQHATVFERAGRDRRGARVEVDIRELKSEASAERSVQRRVETLTRKEYLRAGNVERALPTASSQDERASVKQAAYVERAVRVAGFDQRMLAFFEAWQARGYDPLGSFQQEGQRKREDWNAIAVACVSLAGETFEVYFSRRTVVDEEHGTRGPVREREFAHFYRSPAHVADIALAKIRGERGDIDDGFPDWQSSTEQAALPYAGLDPEVRRVLERWREQRSGQAP